MSNLNLREQSINRLVFATLVPHDEILIKPEAIRDKLMQLDFLGDAIPAMPDCYALADGFMQYVIFMGCSPAIELEVPDNVSAIVSNAAPIKFSFMRMNTCTQQARFFHADPVGQLKQVPRCPHCRRPVIADLADLQQVLNNSTGQVGCQSCAATSELAELDWRKQTAWGNVFIEIFNVYPHEAVPTDGFLQQLQAVSQSNWQYFYTDCDFSSC